MKSIVFGSNGYLGKHTVNYLEKKGFSVWQDFNRKIDVTELQSLKEINWNVDYVFLFSGKTGTINSFSNYKKFVNTNEVGLLNILESIKNSPFNPKIIFPSSRLVYKGANEELLEEADKETRTIYAVNKLACENYLYAYANAYDMRFTIFRISVPYGNLFLSDYSYGTIGNFINQARTNKKIILYGDGSFRRTFTYIEDLVRWIIESAQLEVTDCEIYNIPGQNLSINEVAIQICKRFNCELERIQYPSELKNLESGSTSFNFKKIKKIISLKETKNIGEWINSINLY